MEMTSAEDSPVETTKAEIAPGDRLTQLLALAAAYTKNGDTAKAASAYRTCLAIDADNFEALHALGIIAAKEQRLAEAIVFMQRAGAIRPERYEVPVNIGLIHRTLGKHADAVRMYRKALAVNPRYARAHNLTGVALVDMGYGGAAEPHFRQAIANDPQSADAHFNLATVLQQRGEIEQAEREYALVPEDNPNFAKCCNNRAGLFHSQGRLAEAVDLYRLAIKIDRQYAEAHANLGLMLLVQGQFDEGWREFNWRWETPSVKKYQRPFAQPMWRGEDLSGKTILLHAEQGAGDTIQFIRFVPLVRARGAARIVVECQPELVRLLSALEDIDSVVPRGADFPGAASLPAFDVHAALLDLPIVFRTDAKSIPDRVPYLKADARATEKWRERVRALPGAKVGLVWAGNPKHANDEKRSMRLDDLAPLRDLPGVSFVSLQKGPGRKQLEASVMGSVIVDIGDELNDFAETAAVVAALDLVIAVDTSVAHLAGALKRPTWVLMPFVPDWRWQLERRDSPWYPSVRLFRQADARNWRSVADALAKELTALADGAALAGEPQAAPADGLKASLDHMTQGRMLEAEVLARAALPRAADTFEGLNLLGVILAQTQRLGGATALLERATALRPDNPEGHLNLGLAYKLVGNLAESEKHYRRGISLKGPDAQALNNLANLLRDQNRFAEAAESYRAALALDPNYADGHANLSITLLMSGKFLEGWQEYDWRWKVAARLPFVRHFAQPLWQGEDLASKTILVHAEQGFGDGIQFIRYLTLVKEKGPAKIILECQPELARLLSRSRLADVVVSRGPDFPGGASLPPFDVQCPLLDLPKIFATTAATIPSPGPYLSPDPRLAAKWRSKLGEYDGVRIGLVWAGNPKHRNDRNRSVALETLEGLLVLPGTTFFSLQMGDARDQLKHRSEAPIIDLAGEITDFDDTAAIVDALDLVITVDTSLVHLAGAMGKPAWVILPYSPDWRWQQMRSDSPWYPTVELFRQDESRDWRAVVAALQARLEKMIGDPFSLEALTAARARAPAGELGGEEARPPAEALPGPTEELARALPAYVAIKRCRHGVMMFNRNDLYVGRSLATYGEFSETESEMLLQIARPGDTVVEAGANIGAHTVAIAKAVGPKGLVVAYEPQLHAFQMLCGNLALNGLANVNAIRAALGAAPGTITVPNLDQTTPYNFGGVSLGRSGKGDSVPVQTIDGLDLRACRLIKIDVEGMEFEVINGAKATIRRFHPILYTENDRRDNSQRLIETLFELDYRVWWHMPPLFNAKNYAGERHDVFPGTVSANLLCVPRGQQSVVPLREVLSPTDWWQT